MLSQSLRKNFGESIMGRWVREFIEKHEGKLIILEGIRRVESLWEFNEFVDAIIWIDTPPDIRYERIKTRWEKSGEWILTREDFDKDDQLETELSLEKFQKIANIVVENSSTKESLYDKLSLILKNS